MLDDREEYAWDTPKRKFFAHISSGAMSKSTGQENQVTRMIKRTIDHVLEPLTPDDMFSNTT